MCRAGEGRWGGGLARDDAGLTLVEMVVSIMVGSLVLAGVATFVITGARATDGANQRNNGVAQLRLATDRLTKEMRTAASPDGVQAAVISAKPEELGFYARLDTLDLDRADVGSQKAVPSVVWLWTRNSADGRRELCQHVAKATVSGAGALSFPNLSTPASRTCSRVAATLARNPGHATFTYLKATDTDTRSDGSSVSTLALNADGSVPLAQNKTIQSVELWLTYDVKTQNSARDASSVARVTFLNVVGGID